MRIQLEISGGLAFFPALAAPVAIESSTLAQANASRLEELVADAQIFTRPAQLLAHGGADTQHYVLTVEDGGNARTLEFRDPISDPAVHDLIAFVRSLAGHPTVPGAPTH